MADEGQLHSQIHSTFDALLCMGCALSVDTDVQALHDASWRKIEPFSVDQLTAASTAVFTES